MFAQKCSYDDWSNGPIILQYMPLYSQTFHPYSINKPNIFMNKGLSIVQKLHMWCDALKVIWFSINIGGSIDYINPYSRGDFFFIRRYFDTTCTYFNTICTSSGLFLSLLKLLVFSGKTCWAHITPPIKNHKILSTENGNCPKTNTQNNQ